MEVNEMLTVYPPQCSKRAEINSTQFFKIGTLNKNSSPTKASLRSEGGTFWLYNQYLELLFVLVSTCAY